MSRRGLSALVVAVLVEIAAVVVIGSVVYQTVREVVARRRFRRTR